MRQIPHEQVIRRMRVENPWWEDPSARTLAEDFRPRAYLELAYPLILERQVRRALVLMGPRRVGKTVLLHHALERLLQDGVEPRLICYLAVDHPLYNGLGLEQLLQLFEEAAAVDCRKEACWVLFDEVQYLKDWEVHLKALVDGYPRVKFVASGSAAAALRLKSQESGAGRFTDFLLPPLTFYEFLKLQNLDSLVEVVDRETFPTCSDLPRLNSLFVDYLSYGGYPEALFSAVMQADPERYVKRDIVDKVLLRDLPSLYGIQDIQELNYLFTTLAYNTAGEVSLEGLSSSSGVAKNTINRYMEYLEAAFLIRRVQRVSRSSRRFKRANFFKTYLTNPSIRSALFAPIEESDPQMGAVVETAVFAQWFLREEQLYYARWGGGAEVDIVKLRSDQRAAWALEVKWSDRFVSRPSELTSLIRFCHRNDLPWAWVTTRTLSDKIRFDNIDLRFEPASLYCFFVGYRALAD